eukprot:885944_1
MAVENTILFAVKIIDTKQETNIIQLANTEMSFKPITINLSSTKDTTIVLGHENRHWSIYFLAAYKGVLKNYAQHINIKQFKSLRVMVDGNIPKGSGLSSSSAFVCGAAVSLLYSNLDASYFQSQLTQSAVASFCIKCEREVGVMSGGMDQTICMTANKGFAKHIEFIPKLRAHDVQLPSSDKVRWIISNCLLEHKLQDEGGTNNYNTRVVECRLSALLLSKLLRIKQWKTNKTFRDIAARTFKLSINCEIVLKSYSVQMSSLSLIDSLLRKIQSVAHIDKTEPKDSATIPVLNAKDYNSSRVTNVIESFCKHYNGLSPDFIVRSPGRVNLIGEHIDYCGYGVFPMAVENTILFAVKIIDTKQETNIIQLANTEMSFKPITINLSSTKDTTIVLGHENRHWSIYFLAAYKGVLKNYAQHINIKQFKSLRVMVDGNIPKGSGLSSSSAFVCGAAVSLLYSNLDASYFQSQLTQSAVASFCIKCEREVGVMSGGMDQTICMTANKGFAKHIEFIPKLRAHDVQLPSSDKVRWIISNCLLEHKLQDEGGTNNYNTRVVECRLSALLLSKLLRIKQWKTIKTFRDIAALIDKTKELLNDKPYSIEMYWDWNCAH